MEPKIENVVADDRLENKPEEDVFSRGEYRHDYVTNGQIMVTITLSEYRTLLKAEADRKVSEANSKFWDANRERDELRKQVEDLQKQLNGLKFMLAGAAHVQDMMAQENTNDRVDSAD
jgi:hypothetical protein